MIENPPLRSDKRRRSVQAAVNARLPAGIAAALADRTRVSGAPHDFYRYPARFSPMFARAAIQAFTSRGDVVIDPFCGGGTTIVEAVSLGRRAIGADVSALATFLTRTKTEPLSVDDRRVLAAWVEIIRRANLNGTLSNRTALADTYARNLPSEPRRFFHWALDQITLLPTHRQQNFARLILLAVGQRAVDCKTRGLSRARLRHELCTRIASAMPSFSEFTRDAAALNGVQQSRLPSLRRVIERSSAGLGKDGRIPRSWLPAKLVLTSPPYPGVHMVYHRWQIKGRKETATPFWLANQRDGSGESHYLLGPRGQKGLVTYYERLQAAFSSVAAMIDRSSIVVQLVAFSDPTWQLGAYLDTMRAAGLREIDARECGIGSQEKRMWRNVPGRRWYATSMGNIPASKEVLLLHQLDSGQLTPLRQRH